MLYPDRSKRIAFCCVIALTLQLSLPEDTSAQASESTSSTAETLEAQQLSPALPFINTISKLPQHFPVPGGIAIVPLNMQNEKKPTVKFGSREVLVIPHQNQWQAIVGLPGDILPGNYILATVDEEDETGKVPFRIVTLPPPAQDQINDTFRDESSQPVSRIATPIELIAAAASSDYINPAMTVPRDISIEDRNLTPSFIFAPVVEFELLIPYGKTLRQNKIVEHYYLSYVTKAESQVYAPAPGVVVKVVENERYSGLIYINHGGGIVSLLGNLDKILVQEGQLLDRGEQVARADFDGSLDRSRVDYGLSLNGFLIDPLQFPSTP